jgi:hypothetical protein
LPPHLKAAPLAFCSIFGKTKNLGTAPAPFATVRNKSCVSTVAIKMRIVYQNVVWLLIFVAYNYLCLADHRDVITVGGCTVTLLFTPLGDCRLFQVHSSTMKTPRVAWSSRAPSRPPTRCNRTCTTSCRLESCRTVTLSSVASWVSGKTASVLVDRFGCSVQHDATGLGNGGDFWARVCHRLRFYPVGLLQSGNPLYSDALAPSGLLFGETHHGQFLPESGAPLSRARCDREESAVEEFCGFVRRRRRTGQAAGDLEVAKLRQEGQRDSETVGTRIRQQATSEGNSSFGREQDHSGLRHREHHRVSEASQRSEADGYVLLQLLSDFAGKRFRGYRNPARRTANFLGRPHSRLFGVAQFRQHHDNQDCRSRK